MFYIIIIDIITSYKIGKRIVLTRTPLITQHVPGPVFCSRPRESRSFPRLVDGRLRAVVLSNVVARLRLVVRLLHGHGRIIVVSVNRHHGLLRRAVKTTSVNTARSTRPLRRRRRPCRTVAGGPGEPLRAIGDLNSLTWWKPSGPSCPRRRRRHPCLCRTPCSCAVRCAFRRPSL